MYVTQTKCKELFTSADLVFRPNSHKTWRKNWQFFNSFMIVAVSPYVP